MSPWISPGRMSSDTSRSTSTPENETPIPLAVSAASAVIAPAVRQARGSEPPSSTDNPGPIRTP